MSRMILAMCSLTVCAAPSVLIAQDGWLIAGDVKEATAMELADQVLPNSIRAEIVSGDKRQRFVAGPSFWIGYNSDPFKSYVFPEDFCTRWKFEVELSPRPRETLEQFLGEDEDHRQVAISSIERKVTVALPVEGDVSLANCRTAEGYLVVEPYSLAALTKGYRQLIGAIRLARSEERVPFAISCTLRPFASDRKRECENAITSLAELPMAALHDISVNDDPDDEFDELKGYEASFGASEPDGLSWRVYWSIDEAGQVAELRLRKIGVVYH